MTYQVTYQVRPHLIRRRIFGSCEACSVGPGSLFSYGSFFNLGTILVNMCCIRSSSLLSLTYDGDQADTQYSRCGRIRLLYNFTSSWWNYTKVWYERVVDRWNGLDQCIIDSVIQHLWMHSRTVYSECKTRRLASSWTNLVRLAEWIVENLILIEHFSWANWTNYFTPRLPRVVSK